MAELTPKQFAAEIKKRANLLKAQNKPLQIAAQTAHALRVKRIFHDGLDSNNSSIGSYSTSPEVWIDNDYHRRGGNKGKSGRAKKTSYYKSYADFKKSQGFGSNIVLRQTNRLQSDFANRQISPNSDGLPNSKPIRVTKDRYIERITSENEDKIKGRENIFNFTNKEKAVFNRVYNATATKILNGQTTRL